MTVSRRAPAILATLLSMGVCLAQSDRGTISGSVSDPTGAAVPEARIQIVEIETNNTLDLATNEQGLYVAPNLPVGTYRVVVRREGFATLIREPVLVRA